MSPFNTRDDIVEKTNALRPNAARGKEVAVPRWSGKLVAARFGFFLFQFPVYMHTTSEYLPALIAAEKAAQPPSPVRNEHTSKKPTLTEPWPFSYAFQ